MKNTLKLCEIYTSIQGEGPTTGIPSIFIRFSGCNLHCYWCLIAKTKITTLDGIKQIKDIKKGDQIFGYRDGEVTFTRVLRTFKRTIRYKELMKIVTNTSKLICTKGHKVFVEGRNWKRADSVQVRDRIKSTNGSSEIAEIKLNYSKNTSVDVYNIETDTNNYFANDLLVHNCDIPQTWNWEGTDFSHMNEVKYTQDEESTLLSSEDIFANVIAITKQYPHINNVILTGGEPLIHQRNDKFIELLELLEDGGFRIEIETNGTIVPSDDVDCYIDQYNVSPKLAGSANLKKTRERPKAYKFFKWRNFQEIGTDGHTAFKFVVDIPSDILEVDELVKEYEIPKHMVYIMPQAMTREQLQKRSESVINLCIERGYRFCNRLQIQIWSDERKR